MNAPGIFQNPLLAPLWAALATFGFATLFGLGIRDLLLVAAGAALGWAVSVPVANVTGSVSLGAFAASAVIGFWGEAMSAITKRPATVYTVCAILPLVPGGGMYYTMLETINGAIWSSFEIGLQTMKTAGAIAAGLAASSAIARIIK